MGPCSTSAADGVSQGHPTQPLLAAQLADALLKIQTVCAVTGLSASSVNRKVADGSFPAPIKLGRRCTRWKSGHVTCWIRAQG